MSMKQVRNRHKGTGMLLAEEPLDSGITPFEGDFYIARKYLKTDRFRTNYVPGICIFKFLCAWINFQLDDGKQVHNLGWLYWLSNPLLPFIWYRNIRSYQHVAV